MKRFDGFTRYAIGVLVYNLLVIQWGAYVRASGSGAGCGSHWPLCNGVVVPRSPAMNTIIEFTHRLTSGVSLLLVVILVVWAFRAFRKGDPRRTGAALSMTFIITEALLGASLVLFGWTAQNAIAIPTASHLVNTFLLLAALSLTVYWAAGGGKLRLRGQGLLLWALAVGLLGVLLLGMTGAVTALGDTLFPSASFSEGVLRDFQSGSPLLVRLRVFHPLVAITVGLYLVFVAGLLALFRPDPALRRFVIVFIGLFALQGLAGLTNLFLNAPIFMQLIHLFLADSVWISLVMLSATALSGSAGAEVTVEPPVPVEGLALEGE